MDTETDQMLKGIILRVAATEQIALTMLAMMAREYEEPARFAAAVLAEVRERFAGGGGGDAQGAEDFRQGTSSLVDEIEIRVLALIGSQPADG